MQPTFPLHRNDLFHYVPPEPAMTVGQLRDALADLPDDLPVRVWPIGEPGSSDSYGPDLLLTSAATSTTTPITTTTTTQSGWITSP